MSTTLVGHANYNQVVWHRSPPSLSGYCPGVGRRRQHRASAYL